VAVIASSETHPQPKVTTLKSLTRKLSALTLGAVLLAGSVSVGSAAYAADPVLDRTQALTEFRAGLVSAGATADVVAFDALTTAQRSSLADYLTGEVDVTLTPPADATWSNDGVATLGDFQWGLPAGTTAAAARNSNNIPIWGTQWFSVAGIKLIEVKNSMTYTTTYNSSTGTRVTAIQSYSCRVTLDRDIFADVTSSQNAAFPDVWEAESQCFVSVKRGFPSPWGVIEMSKYEALHTIRGDNMGNVVFNGWT